jgi:tetratricopeptide (TPR) repeat protein
LALFDIGEMFFAGVFFFALLLLILILIAAEQTQGSLWRRLTTPFKLARAVAVRFRVRTALVVIALFGVYLGWEIHAWRTWKLRSAYLNKRDEASIEENSVRALLRSNRELSHRVEEMNEPLLARESLSAVGYYRSRASLVADLLANQEMRRREADQLMATIAAYAHLKAKYDRAASQPWMAVPPDEPLPKPARSAYQLLGAREYGRALETFDELAQAYPDFVEAHLSYALIRASCPDAQYRDGELAVARATRGCALTRWQDAEALGTLAAAYAEAGDFVSAVKWQKRVIELTPFPPSREECEARLALYHSGNPYRQK